MIYVDFNTVFTTAQCHMSGQIFDADNIVAFYLENNLMRPVCTEVALKEGFTMTEKTFRKLDKIVMDYFMKGGDIWDHREKGNPDNQPY